MYNYGYNAKLTNVKKSNFRLTGAKLLCFKNQNSKGNLRRAAYNSYTWNLVSVLDLAGANSSKQIEHLAGFVMILRYFRKSASELLKLRPVNFECTLYHLSLLT
jgi:hypothetical protein